LKTSPDASHSHQSESVNVEQALNHSGSERLQQHLFNPESVRVKVEQDSAILLTMNVVEQGLCNSRSDELQQALVNPGSLNWNVEQWHIITSEGTLKDLLKNESRAVEDCVNTQTLSESNDREMLIKFNIRRAVVRIERLNTEASSCQPVRADSSDNKRPHVSTHFVKQFERKSDMDVHMRTDALEAPRDCTLCDKYSEAKDDVHLRDRTLCDKYSEAKDDVHLLSRNVTNDGINACKVAVMVTRAL